MKMFLTVIGLSILSAAAFAQSETLKPAAKEKSPLTKFHVPSPSSRHANRTPRHYAQPAPGPTTPPCTATGGTDCPFAPPGHPDAESLARIAQHVDSN